MKDNTLRLNPVLWAFNTFGWIWLLIIWGLILLMAFMRFEGDQRQLLADIMVAPFLTVVNFVYRMICSTKKIKLGRDEMYFVYYQSTYAPFLKSKRRMVRVKYSLSAIEKLRFEQNWFEKIFDSGHFSFEANAVYEASSEYIEPKTEFVMYGLSNFRQTKKEICDILGVDEDE